MYKNSCYLDLSPSFEFLLPAAIRLLLVASCRHRQASAATVDQVLYVVEVLEEVWARGRSPARYRLSARPHPHPDQNIL